MIHRSRKGGEINTVVFIEVYKGSQGAPFTSLAHFSGEPTLGKWYTCSSKNLFRLSDLKLCYRWTWNLNHKIYKNFGILMN